ncbi:MAG: isoamylase early set domain-containing protein [Desulfobacterales bacterium]
MSLKKQYLKTRPVCKVTFRLPPEVAKNSDSAYLVGSFNNWDTQKTRMKKLKNGSFTVTIDLPIDQEYQFRYFLDQNKWENDGEADKYVPSGISGTENSVVVV